MDLYISALPNFAQLGTLVSKRFLRVEPSAYIAGLGEEADGKADDEAPLVQGTPVGAKEMAVLRDSSLWLTDPDHHRVRFLGTILQLIWPVMSGAVYKEVMVQAKQPLEDACKMVRVLVVDGGLSGRGRRKSACAALVCHHRMGIALRGGDWRCVT